MRLSPGQGVRFLYGTREVEGRVVEDRGDLGVGGRQLVVVEVPQTDGDPIRLEMPAEELTLVGASVSPGR